MGRNKSALNPIAYTGVNAQHPPDFTIMDRAPTSDDYKEFNVSHIVLDRSKLNETPPRAPTADDLYMLVSKDQRIAKATWISLGSGDVETITGDTGGAISPDNNANINLEGGNGITVDGNQGNNALTVNSTAGTTAFNVIPTNNKNNVVGANGGTDYVIEFDEALYDVNGDFDLNNHQFVCPEDGLYAFEACVSVGNLSSNMTRGYWSIFVDSTGPLGQKVVSMAAENPYASRTTPQGQWRTSGALTVLLNAGDIVYVPIQVRNGSGNTASIITTGGDRNGRTWFAGHRIA